MKQKLTLALILLLGLSATTTQCHRLHSRDDDPDEIELNGTDLKNNRDVNIYSKTFVGEGKSISKLNQEEEEKRSASDDSNYDHGKAIDEISKQVSVNKINQAPMIERAENRPTHIEITVPKMDDKPKKKADLMTRTEMANTIMWARKDEIEQARLPRNQDVRLHTQSMNKDEKSELFHQIVNSAERDNAEAADPSMVPVTSAMIEQQRMDQAEQIDGQVMDLEDM